MNFATDLMLKIKGRADSRIVDFQVWIIENYDLLIQGNKGRFIGRAFSLV